MTGDDVCLRQNNLSDKLQDLGKLVLIGREKLISVRAEIRAIDKLEESIYKDRGKKYPGYLMTKDRFTFLVMGYRGQKAAAFKEVYINRFNR